MKYLFTFIFFVLTSYSLAGQSIEIHNETLNSYEIKIYKNGRCVHHHLMHPKNMLTIDVLQTDSVIIEYKRLTGHCDNGQLEKKLAGYGRNGITGVKSGGWVVYRPYKLPTDGYLLELQFPPYFCKQA